MWLISPIYTSRACLLSRNIEPLILGCLAISAGNQNHNLHFIPIYIGIFEYLLYQTNGFWHEMPRMEMHTVDRQREGISNLVAHCLLTSNYTQLFLSLYGNNKALKMQVRDCLCVQLQRRAHMVI